MPTQPTSALRHQRRFARLAGVTVAAVRRAWRQMDPRANWGDQYASQVGPRVTALVAASQVAATREADGYVADVLTELAFAPAGEPEPGPVLVDSSLAGFDGGGLPIQTLLEQVVREAGLAYNGLVEDLTAEYESNLAAAQKALDDTAGVLEGYVETILADTMRAAEEAAMAQRPWVAGFVRMAEPGACSRCILLSGKFYLFNEGFLRHPRCRCTHVPTPDARTEAGKRQRRDMETLNSPERLFESLSTEEQDRIFTQAGAQAIRDGADIGKVVNARRGMSKSQAGRIQKVNVNGRDVYVTTTGTRGGRRGRTRPVRLMPEQILLEAGEDVVERIRLLKLHGYITG